MLNWNLIREVGVWDWLWRTTARQLSKRVLRRDQLMRLPSGELMQLPRASRFASEIYLTRANVDWGSERLLFDLLEKKGWLIDVGANIGYYSLYMYPRVHGVVCFEPDPRARAVLEANLAGRHQALVLPKAAGREAGRAAFILADSTEVSHLGRSDTTDEGTSSILVEVVTLSGFVASQHLKVEAIKIDAEGHDFDVLAGALHLLEAQRPLVLTEATPTAELFGLLREVRYEALGFARDTQSRRLSFRRLSDSPASSGETKMIFLVPTEVSQRVLAAGERIAVCG